MDLGQRLCLRLLVPLGRLPGRKTAVNLNFCTHHFEVFSLCLGLIFLPLGDYSQYFGFLLKCVISWLLHTFFLQNSQLLCRSPADGRCIFKARKKSKLLPPRTGPPLPPSPFRVITQLLICLTQPVVQLPSSLSQPSAFIYLKGLFCAVRSAILGYPGVKSTCEILPKAYYSLNTFW